MTTRLFKNLTVLAVTVLFAGAASAVPIIAEFNINANGAVVADTGNVTTANTISAGAPNVAGFIQTSNIGLVAGSPVILAPNLLGVKVGDKFTKEFVTPEGTFVENLTVTSRSPTPNALGVLASGTIVQTIKVGTTTFDPTPVFWSAAYTQNQGPGTQINASFNNSTEPPLPDCGGGINAPAVCEPCVPPKLFPSEQGAFKAMEVAAQTVEASIGQKGCEAATYPIEVNTDKNGNGTLVLGTPPADAVALKVLFSGVLANNGRRYGVNGLGNLGGLAYKNIIAGGSYNIRSAMQELSTGMDVSSTVTGTFDRYRGTVIKDYCRLEDPKPIPTGFENVGEPVSTVIDYGYQQISKKGYIKAKYWQQSVTWREDGVNAGTLWLKTRVAPSGPPCAIEIRMEGYGQFPADNAEGFNEKGTLRVLTAPVGPFIPGE